MRATSAADLSGAYKSHCKALGRASSGGVSLAEDHSFGCLDLALPEGDMSVHPQLLSWPAASNRVCASRVEEMILSKQAGGSHGPTSPQGVSEPDFPSSGGILAPWGSKNIYLLRREDRPT